MKKIIEAMWDYKYESFWENIKNSSESKVFNPAPIDVYDHDVIFEFLNSAVELKGPSEVLKKTFRNNFPNFLFNLPPKNEGEDHNFINFFEKLMQEDANVAQYHLEQLNNNFIDDLKFNRQLETLIKINDLYFKEFPNQKEMLWSSREEVKNHYIKNGVLSEDEKPAILSQFLDLISAEGDTLSKLEVFLGRRTSKILILMKSKENLKTLISEVVKNIDSFNETNSSALHILMPYADAENKSVLENKIWEVDEKFLRDISVETLFNTVVKEVNTRSSWLSKSYFISHKLLDGVFDSPYFESSSKQKDINYFLSKSLFNHVFENYNDVDGLKVVYDNITGISDKYPAFVNGNAGFFETLTDANHALLKGIFKSDKHNEDFLSTLMTDTVFKNFVLRIDNEPSDVLAINRLRRCNEIARESYLYENSRNFNQINTGNLQSLK